MKPLPSLLNAVLTGALLLTVLLVGLPQLPAHAAGATPTPTVAPSAPPSCSSNRTVQVSGAAVVNVAPDRVLIQIGVQSNGVTVGEVEAANTRAIQKVIQALRAQGVAEKDIATDWYIIEPLYEDYDSLYIKGYRIHNIVADIGNFPVFQRILRYKFPVGGPFIMALLKNLCDAELMRPPLDHL
jgi:uncharacterized protein YggE